MTEKKTTTDPTEAEAGTEALHLALSRIGRVTRDTLARVGGPHEAVSLGSLRVNLAAYAQRAASAEATIRRAVEKDDHQGAMAEAAALHLEVGLSMAVLGTALLTHALSCPGPLRGVILEALDSARLGGAEELDAWLGDGEAGGNGGQHGPVH